MSATIADTYRAFVLEVLSGREILFHARVEVERHFAKKNGREIKYSRSRRRLFLGKSDALHGAEEFLTFALHEHARARGLENPIECPVWCVMLFTFSEPEFFTLKGPVSKTLPDLSNLYELPQDCLQSAAVLSNDTQIVAHDLSRRLPGASTELELWLIEPGDELSWAIDKRAELIKQAASSRRRRRANDNK